MHSCVAAKARLFLFGKPPCACSWTWTIPTDQVSHQTNPRNFCLRKAHGWTSLLLILRRTLKRSRRPRPRPRQTPPIQCLQNPGDAHALWTALRCSLQTQRSDSHGYGIGGVPIRRVCRGYAGPLFRRLDGFRRALLLHHLWDLARPPHAALWAGICAITQHAVRPPSRQRHPAAREPYNSTVAHASHTSAATLQAPLPCQHVRAIDGCLAKSRTFGSQVPDDPATLAISLPYRVEWASALSALPRAAADHLTDIAAAVERNAQSAAWAVGRTAAAPFSTWVALIAEQSPVKPRDPVTSEYLSSKGQPFEIMDAKAQRWAQTWRHGTSQDDWIAPSRTQHT